MASFEVEDIMNEQYPLRKNLNMPEDVNFGLEIELNNVDFDKLKNRISLIGSDYTTKTDLSILDYGAEVVTPVLKNQIQCWKKLKKLAKAIGNIEHSFYDSSFQVNLDLDLFKSEDDIVYFIKYLMLNEDIIYTFSLSDNYSFRHCLTRYALPLSLSSLAYGDFNEFYDRLINLKRYGIQIKHFYNDEKKDIIEFRMPNGTDNVILWQNYVNTFYHLVNYFSTDYDREKIEYLFKKLEKLEHVSDLTKLNFDKACNFADDIFIQEEDKKYFLRQYVGKKLN